jgi:hypothetical protein
VHLGHSSAGNIHVTGRDHLTDNSKKSTINTGGVFVALVVIVAVVVGGVFAANKAGELLSTQPTAASTCAQFLDADNGDQQRSLIKIAQEKGVSGAGSPLALPAVQYSCSSNPTAKVGDVIARFRGQF